MTSNGVMTADVRYLYGSHNSFLSFYTVNHKKRDILFLTVTLANLNRFLQFVYHFNHEEILHATVVKFITSPYLYAHLTWKNKKPTFLSWFLKRSSVHMTATLSYLNRCQ